MTSVQQRTAALLAVLALVFGCACAALAFQQQAYAADTNLAAGTTFERATNLSIANDSRSSSNKTEFNAKTDNNFYKFTTSKRDSRYKLTVESYKGYDIYITLYDAGRHRIAYMKTDKEKGQSWTFKNLQRNAVYYVELWRFVADASDYLQKGKVLDLGYAETAYPPYKITLAEKVTKPVIEKARVWSTFETDAKHKHWLRMKFIGQSYNTEKVQIKIWWFQNGVQHTFYRYTPKSSYSTWVVHWGSTYPYRVSVRPYMTVNGKRVYGKWAKAYVKNSSGNWVKTPEKNKRVAKLVIKDK